jgi:hypothetical protein
MIFNHIVNLFLLISLFVFSLAIERTSVVSLLHGCVVYFLSRALTLMEKKEVAAEGAMRKQV